MINVNLMVFDFDGTLVDTGEDIVRAVNFTLRSLGLPERPYEEAIGFIGDGVQRLLERSLGEEKKRLYAEAQNIFLAYYGDHLLDTTRLYTGVDDVLRHFEGKRKWIVTNKLYEFTIRIAGALKIHGHFDGIIGRDNTPYVKPDARILEGLMKQHGVSGERTVVIGDGVHDMGMARNAGAWGCAFLNGLGDRKGLLRQRPDFTCENILELKTLFC
jgi:phosphoglycolate phosphatase